MSLSRNLWLGLLALFAVVAAASTAGGRAAAAEAQHPLHHGRRHRLDAAEHLPSRLDGRGNP